MKKRQIIISSLVLLVIILAALGFVVKNQFQTQIKELFRMNKALQEEGYYMAEFEFKMLGIAYYLDKGQYYIAKNRLSEFHQQLKSKQDLIKIEDFDSKEAEIEFFLNMQNPKTGAFMDETYPYCTYWSVTENVVDHLNGLCKAIGKPLKLKYTLHFLDEINTPEKLTAYLNDVSYIGWIASKIPESTFHFTRDLMNMASKDSTSATYNLYNFSPEWKHTLLKWMYEFQDSTTGFWGPKNRNNGKLIRLDFNNTSSITKAFVDKNGNDIYESFPMKHKDKIFASTLDMLSAQLPDDSELDKMHDWKLKTAKSIKMLLRYLWKNASQNSKELAKLEIEKHLKVVYDKYYVAEEGAFSFYPNSEHASLDGSGGLTLFVTIGALSGEKQSELWGSPEENITDLGKYEKANISTKDFELFADSLKINSLRIYNGKPNYESLTDSVLAIVYPHETNVLDIVDVIPKMEKWINKTPLIMGNWSTRGYILQKFEKINIESVPVFKQEFPLNELNAILKENRELHVIAYDILQIPIYKIVFQINNKSA